MKREVVQDFLNLPGIMGVALMHRRSRPYFCGVDQVLNFQQKEALAQGIQQVIETTPVGFHFFEFQFNGHQVYIYKLGQGIVLLVLTVDNLGYTGYSKVVDRLKAELQENITDAIATFRLLAGSTALPEENYWKQQSESSHASPVQASSAQAAQPPLSQPPLSPTQPKTPVAKVAAPATPVFLRDLLLALNHLSHFTKQYLGASVAAGNWKSSRPEAEWLNQFQIDRTAQIGFMGQMDGQTLVSAEQHEWIQIWVAGFIDRCSKVIRNFPKTVRQKALNPQQKMLLLPDPAD
ncbi:MAG: hypothetical protein HY785_15095 [Oscillatoriophycideae cyanobacterium NC_groundwater_1537_Pr4_S-0.65um_50_18]|nr:hypothetical protein [Oscillatoriophycideae cyanobacterium NC_groundwater_1537_Pr4_S-0.65um_50_18]